MLVGNYKLARSRGWGKIESLVMVMTPVILGLFPLTWAIIVSVKTDWWVEAHWAALLSFAVGIILACVVLAFIGLFVGFILGFIVRSFRLVQWRH